MPSIPSFMIEPAPAAHATREPLLRVRDLAVEFRTRDGVVGAVDGVSLELDEGQCLGVVGESGSGKSVTFAAVMGLIKHPGRIIAGSIQLGGRELVGLPASAYRAIRGRELAMTMQDALTALNPAYTVSDQIVEVLLAHDDRLSGSRRQRARAAAARALELMRLVGIPSAQQRLNDYPHQFSGGMRQRIMIAIALACQPRVLIADEPTTALDVTIQAQILELITDIRQRLGTSVVIITHDLGVVAQYCDRIAVMYAGQVVEQGPTRDVIDAPLHPYTRGLLRSIPRLAHLDDDLVPIEGQVPDLIDLPAQCRFLERCCEAGDACRQPIDMFAHGPLRAVRCVRAAGALEVIA